MNNLFNTIAIILIFVGIIMYIIQTWKTNQIPDIYLEFIESVKKYGNKFTFLFFNDQDIINFIKNTFPEYLEICFT